MNLDKFEPLTAKHHSTLKFTAVTSYQHAKNDQWCPLLAKEVIPAAAHFPVVFPTTGLAAPVAILSFTPGGNRYVADNGSWQAAYLPLHYQRYPFSLGNLVANTGDCGNNSDDDADSTGDETGKNAATLAVLIDADAEQFASDSGTPLFTADAGECIPSAALQGIKKELQLYQEEFLGTKKIVQQLRQAGVLVPAKLDIKLDDGEIKAITGFSIVDMARIAKLDEQLRAFWVKIGLMKIIEAHLNSIAVLIPKPEQSTAAQD